MSQSKITIRRLEFGETENTAISILGPKLARSIAPMIGAVILVVTCDDEPGAEVLELAEEGIEKGGDRCDYIMIATGGREIKVLDAAREMIAEFRPILIVEMFGQGLAKNGHAPGELEALIRELGYTMRMSGQPPRWNWICHTLAPGKATLANWREIPDEGAEVDPASIPPAPPVDNDHVAPGTERFRVRDASAEYDALTKPAAPWPSKVFVPAVPPEEVEARATAAHDAELNAAAERGVEAVSDAHGDQPPELNVD